jgi:acetyltransferase-like isoleucine patch superfamily enzyme
VHWGWLKFQQAGRVTADTPGGKAFARFGRGSHISFPAGLIFGEGAIEIGDDTLIGAQVTITAGIVPGQDLLQLTVVRIGDRCVIGRGSHIIAHESVEIGDDVWAGPDVYIPEHS